MTVEERGKPDESNEASARGPHEAPQREFGASCEELPERAMSAFEGVTEDER